MSENLFIENGEQNDAICLMVAKKYDALKKREPEVECHNTKAQHCNDLKFIFVASTVQQYYVLMENLPFFLPEEKIIGFPCWDTSLFSRHSPSIEIMQSRIIAMSQIKKLDFNILIIPVQAILHKLPVNTSELFFGLNNGQHVDFASLAQKLIELGYQRNNIAAANGEFAVRGEVFDIACSKNQGYRIYCAWNKIEQIKIYSLNEQIATENINEILIPATSEILINTETISMFKGKAQIEYGLEIVKSSFYEAIITNQNYNGHEHYGVLFYQRMQTLSEILINLAKENNMVEFYSNHDLKLSLNNYLNQAREYHAKHNFGAKNYLPPLSSIADHSQVNQFLNIQKVNILETQKLDIYDNKNFYKNNSGNKHKALNDFINFINKRPKNMAIIFCSHLQSDIEIILAAFENNQISYSFISSVNDISHQTAVHIANLNIENNFSLNDKSLIFITAKLIFGNKKTLTKKNKKSIINLLEESNFLKPNDHVIHKDFGIGKFDSIVPIAVGKSEHDFIKLLYENNDILYLPVENSDLIKKYTEFAGEINIQLDKLGNISWQKRKAKVKKNILAMANEIISIAALRNATKVEPTSIEYDLYNKFCDNFPYIETEDQQNAIDDVKEDLISGRLLDRLICGDVGFGKTEVAARAAAMIGLHKSNLTTVTEHAETLLEQGQKDEYIAQIAVIVPTTILCRQHHQNFTERFKGFSIKIDSLSRLKNAKEARLIKQKIANGEIKIIIGTHALLNSNIKFKNLKLIIIDEEQHFGVVQKEKLKQLRSSIHVLSMSATPIPRTLQMATVGIKDLSIIASPPVDRLPIQTRACFIDMPLIQEVLISEKARNGRSFIVTPRIKYIETLHSEIQKLVPEQKICIAHGQMPATELDMKMNDFYEGKYDILICTAIIESGIDVPTANTIIIHNADMFGLGQLYQLRGRVGRSQAQAYAYLLYDAKKYIKPNSQKKLEIMQNINSLGAGFTIASYDMDLRGSGNLLGDKQSGNIKEVGSELYNEMLQEAVIKERQKQELANETPANGLSCDLNEQVLPVINLPININIPTSYISDDSLRLSLYRRIAKFRDLTQINEFELELKNRFGSVPQELQNLFSIIMLKQQSITLKISKIDFGQKAVSLKFTDSANGEAIIRFQQKYPRQIKLLPGNKIVIQHQNKLSPVEITQAILQDLLKMHQA